MDHNKDQSDILQREKVGESQSVVTRYQVVWQYNTAYTQSITTTCCISFKRHLGNVTGTTGLNFTKIRVICVSYHLENKSTYRYNCAERVAQICTHQFAIEHDYFIYYMYINLSSILPLGSTTMAVASRRNNPIHRPSKLGFDLSKKRIV